MEGNKTWKQKEEEKSFKNIFICTFVFIIILGAVGGKVYFDLKTAVTKAYVNPPTQMTSISLKRKSHLRRQFLE